MRRVSAGHKRELQRNPAVRCGILFVASWIFIGPATAQESKPDRLDSTLQFMNLKAAPGTTPAFVEQTRPKSTDFMSIGTQHPTRTVKPKTAADFKNMEAELDAARARNERSGGVAPAVVPLKNAKAPAKAPKAKPAT